MISISDCSNGLFRFSVSITDQLNPRHPAVTYEPQKVPCLMKLQRPGHRTTSLRYRERKGQNYLREHSLPLAVSLPQTQALDPNGPREYLRISCRSVKDTGGTAHPVKARVVVGRDCFDIRVCAYAPRHAWPSYSTSPVQKGWIIVKLAPEKCVGKGSASKQDSTGLLPIHAAPQIASSHLAARRSANLNRSIHIARA